MNNFLWLAGGFALGYAITKNMNSTPASRQLVAGPTGPTGATGAVGATGSTSNPAAAAFGFGGGFGGGLGGNAIRVDRGWYQGQNVRWQYQQGRSGFPRQDMFYSTSDIPYCSNLLAGRQVVSNGGRIPGTNQCLLTYTVDASDYTPARLAQLLSLLGVTLDQWRAIPTSAERVQAVLNRGQRMYVIDPNGNITTTAWVSENRSNLRYPYGSNVGQQAFDTSLMNQLATNVANIVDQWVALRLSGGSAPVTAPVLQTAAPVLQTSAVVRSYYAPIRGYDRSAYGRM